MSIRAFNAASTSLGYRPGFVSNIDADISCPPTYFEEILARLVADPSIGLAAGLCYEQKDGTWSPVHVTTPFLRGGLLTCRIDCYDRIAPYEERVGWDSIACIRANVYGWSTLLVDDIHYRHHRRTGERDRTRWSGWRLEGELAHYLWYRPTYLAVRAAYRSLREPTALGLIDGYVRAALARRERYPDARVRTFMRRHQRLRGIPRRRREITGATLRDPSSRAGDA